MYLTLSLSLSSSLSLSLSVRLCSVAQSVPSSVIQIYALLTATGGIKALPLMSVLVSISTIALGTTTICFDFDLDPEKRMHSPDFYGYIPNSSGQRTVVFFSMFVFSACHIVVRVLGIALLTIINPMLTAAVLGGDMLFFMIFKVARNDLRHFLKLPGGVKSWIASFVMRFFVKLLADMTVYIELRRPQALGGLYWSTGLVIGQVTSFVAVYLYSKKLAAEKQSEHYDAMFERGGLWILVGALEATFIVFFGVFLASMKTKYRATFFSSMTAIQFAHKNFREATTDQVKIDILTNCHPAYYAGIREELQQWLNEKFETWESEKPEWYTARVKKNIPVDMIPVPDASERRTE